MVRKRRRQQYFVESGGKIGEKVKYNPMKLLLAPAGLSVATPVMVENMTRFTQMARTCPLFDDYIFIIHGTNTESFFHRALFKEKNPA